MSRTVEVAVHLDRETLRASLRSEASTGLRSAPKELSPKWFYDATGSELFERITALPEYYPTRAEASILDRVAPLVPDLTRAHTLVELGSGSSAKTRLLLDAFITGGCLAAFVPFDVSEDALRSSVTALATDYPGIDIHGVVGDFDHHLGAIPDGGRRLVAFLGGTIGNYPSQQRADLLRRLARVLDTGDGLLLGTDLVKDVARLEAAYNDPQGVTRDFNLNVLRVLNRELGADFDLEAFAHVAFYDPEQEWIEMRVRSLTGQKVTLAGIGLQVTFEEDEEMRTEVSAKFRPEAVGVELAAAGFELVRWWTDPAADFGVSLSFRR